MDDSDTPDTSLSTNLMPSGLAACKLAWQLDVQHKPHWESWRALALRVLFLVTCWWVAAVFVTVSMKSLLSSNDSTGTAPFPFPFMLTSLTNSSTGVIALLLLRAARCQTPSPPPPRCGETLRLLAIGAIQGLEIACSNKALLYLSVSMRTMTNSMNVLFMMVTARGWGLELLDTWRVVAGLLLTAGAAMQGLGGRGFGPGKAARDEVRGILFQLTSMMAAAQRWALLQVMLQHSRRGSGLERTSKSKLQLVATILPVTALVCFVLSLCFEEAPLTMEALLQLDLLRGIFIVTGGIIVLTVAELELVRVTSAVAMQVLAALHQIPIVLAGVALFHDRVSLPGAFGFGLCILGAICYTRARSLEMVGQDAPTRQEPEALEMSVDNEWTG